jgi:hypothetical protein
MLTTRTAVVEHRAFAFRAKPLLLLLLFACALIFAASSSVGAATYTVNTTQEFKDKLAVVQPGDTIQLTAGVTFTGPFTLLNRGGTNTDADWITIRTSAPDSSLPPAGQRITPSYASVLPKIVSAGSGEPALRTQAGAHHYRLIGIEFAPLDSNAFINDLVVLGDIGPAQDTLAEVPAHFTIDRCYIHAYPTQSLKRGVQLNSAYTDILNSYIADFKAVGQDSQAIGSWNGPGPFRIINNYLEGAGENVIFGGETSNIPNLVPSGIEIRNNYFFKPLSWRGATPHWSIKNLFELKNAQHVLVDGNVFENSWGDAQEGFAIVFTVRTQDGTAPWSTIQDVTFTNNVVSHAATALQIYGVDGSFPSQGTSGLTIANNVFDDIDGVKWGGRGAFLLPIGAANLTINHNTIFQSGNITEADGAANTGFTFTNNIVPRNGFGIHGSDDVEGISTINRYFPNSVITKNVIAGAQVVGVDCASSTQAGCYPAGNYNPPLSSFDSLFMNRSLGDYRLASGSPYRNAGTDGKDIGANIDALSAATSGVREGIPAPPAPSLSDDFNDNSRDSKWNIGVLNDAPSAFDSAIPVLEQNQRLEISPRAGVAGMHYAGYVAATAWNLTGAQASVEVAQTVTSGADTIFAIGTDSSNWYRFVVEDGNLYFQDKSAGVKNSASVPYSLAQHRFWRFRHNTANDSMTFETSGDGVNWTTQRTLTRFVTINAARVELDAGTYSPVGGPGTAIFDNFRLDSNNVPPTPTPTPTPTVGLSATIYTVNEGDASGALPVTVNRAGDVSVAFSVEFTTSDASASTPCQSNDNSIASERCDYTTSAGVLSFASGETTKTIPIFITNDAYMESSESFTITLRNPRGAGLGATAAATITITDNDTQPATANPINDQAFFIRQHYVDLLGRQADASGFNFWMNRMTNCAPGDTTCDSIATSQGLFQSDEFQERSGYAYRLYDAVLGRQPRYVDFMSDVGRLNGVKTVAEQRQSKDAYLSDFINRTEFNSLYGQYLTPSLDSAGFVNALCLKAGITPASKQTLINNLQSGARDPAHTVEDFILTPEISGVGTKFYDRGFITMQYFVYLRRDPDANGFSSWQGQLMDPASPHYHDYRFMVGGFVNSDEYRFRFAFISTAGLLFSDDFNDNSRDPVKWTLGLVQEPSTSQDTAVGVFERNQRLEITPRSSLSGIRYNGYLSAGAWDMTDARATVEVVQKSNGSSDTVFAVGVDSNNWLRFVTEDGNLYFQSKVAGNKTSSNVVYNLAQHRFWRYRSNSATNQIFFETSGDGVTWATLRAVSRGFSITALRIELSAGTFGGVSTPGIAIFDNFRLER